MLKVYAAIFVIGVVGAAAYGAKYYYDTTQNTISTLQKNNAQLEVAVQTANESVNTLKADITKLGALNKNLQSQLQKAEQYGDELRLKLSKLNLVVEALKDSKQLEGKMNGASADLWRGLMDDTGNTNDIPLPQWLQSPDSRAGDQDSGQSGESTDTNGSSTETTPTE